MLTEINWDKNLKLLCIPPVRSAVHSVGVVFIILSLHVGDLAALLGTRNEYLSVFYFFTF